MKSFYVSSEQVESAFQSRIILWREQSIVESSLFSSFISLREVGRLLLYQEFLIQLVKSETKTTSGLLLRTLLYGLSMIDIVCDIPQDHTGTIQMTFF